VQRKCNSYNFKFLIFNVELIAKEQKNMKYFTILVILLFKTDKFKFIKNCTSHFCDCTDYFDNQITDK